MFPSLRGQRAQVALAYAAFIFVGISAGVTGVALVAQLGDYGVDKATIAITLVAGSPGFVLASVVAGPLISRVGTRAALLAGGAASLLASGYTASRPQFWGLVAIQVLAGFGIGMLESVLNAHLAALPRATTRLNRLHAFFGIGALLGPPFATWMISSHAWTSIWLVLAIATVPLLVGLLVSYPGRVPVAATAPTASEPQHPRGLLPTALRERGILLGAVLLCLYVGLELAIGNWAFAYLTEAGGQGEVLAGYTVSGLWLGLTVGRLLLAPIATRFGLHEAGMIYVCLGGVTVAAALIWLLPFPAVATVCLLALGFFLGPIFPTTMAMAPKVTSARLVPTGIGIMNAGSVIGGAVLPWLAGATAQGIGLWTLMPLCIILGVLQLLVWWRLVNHRRPATYTSSESGTSGSASLAASTPLPE